MSQLLACSKSDMSNDPHGGDLLRDKPRSIVLEGVPGFYWKALLLFFVLLALTLIFVYLGLAKSHVEHPLLPAANSVLPWTVSVTTDRDVGGASTLTIHEQESSLDYEFWADKNNQYPYATLSLSFDRNADSASFIDLSRYSELSFNSRCNPNNILSLILTTFDEGVPDSASRAAYPIPSRYFSCVENGARTLINLEDLEIPDWWLQSMRMDLSKRDYSLKQVESLAFAISAQSPKDVQSRVVIENIMLRGRDWRLMYSLAVAILLAWGCGLIWVLRQRSRVMTTMTLEKSSDDRTQHVYTQLVFEPQRERQKNSVLQFLSTEYANPEMSLDIAVASLGINRNKINEVLKQETGFTFTGYLNKLRLTEAARLLLENDAANIAEIAYSVGYNNVPYFNKLFKHEYACTPKTYKALIQSRQNE